MFFNLQMSINIFMNSMTILVYIFIKIYIVKVLFNIYIYMSTLIWVISMRKPYFLSPVLVSSCVSSRHLLVCCSKHFVYLTYIYVTHDMWNDIHWHCILQIVFPDNCQLIVNFLLMFYTIGIVEIGSVYRQSFCSFVFRRSFPTTIDI